MADTSLQAWPVLALQIGDLLDPSGRSKACICKRKRKDLSKHSPRPLTVLRALSVVALGEDGGNEAEPFLCSMVHPSYRPTVLPP